MELNAINIFSLVIIAVVALDIRLMSSPETSVAGNRIGALAILSAIIAVLLSEGIIDMPVLIISMITGACIGTALAVKTSTIGIPQLVALFNGLGGAASLLVALVIVFENGMLQGGAGAFSAFLAIIIGGVTFSGSLVAAGKLDRKIPQKSVSIRGHNILSMLFLAGMTLLLACGALYGSAEPQYFHAAAVILLLLSLGFGILFTIRIGGADMPVAISLLNSYSGIAAAVCGFAVKNMLLVSVGALVGAAGFILTRIMCSAMNRSLADILTGRTSIVKADASNSSINNEIIKSTGMDRDPVQDRANNGITAEEEQGDPVLRSADIIKQAKNIIVIPGYGMALSQAQARVKELHDLLEEQGKTVRFAIHPVAGRMPGHMNVLLAEVDIPYDRLYELDVINDDFPETDAAIIVGACDVVNPAAMDAEGTPIYGMPILHAHEAKNVIVCNKDMKPGYSQVENNLYKRENVLFLAGNASDTLEHLISEISQK